MGDGGSIDIARLTPAQSAEVSGSNIIGLESGARVGNTFGLGLGSQLGSQFNTQVQEPILVRRGGRFIEEVQRISDGETMISPGSVTECLNYASHEPIARMASDVIKNKLFSYGFDIYIGADKEKLTDRFITTLDRDWNPFSRRAYEYLQSLGFVPITFRKSEDGDIVPVVPDPKHWFVTVTYVYERRARMYRFYSYELINQKVLGDLGLNGGDSDAPQRSAPRATTKTTTAPGISRATRSGGVLTGGGAASANLSAVYRLVRDDDVYIRTLPDYEPSITGELRSRVFNLLSERDRYLAETQAHMSAVRTAARPLHFVRTQDSAKDANPQYMSQHNGAGDKRINIQEEREARTAARQEELDRANAEFNRLWDEKRYGKGRGGGMSDRRDIWQELPPVDSSSLFVLPEGTDVVGAQVPQPPKEYLAHQAMYREMIAAAYGVPLSTLLHTGAGRAASVAGQTDTFNARISDTINLWRDILEPILTEVYTDLHHSANIYHEVLAHIYAYDMQEQQQQQQKSKKNGITVDNSLEDIESTMPSDLGASGGQAALLGIPLPKAWEEKKRGKSKVNGRNPPNSTRALEAASKRPPVLSSNGGGGGGAAARKSRAEAEEEILRKIKGRGRPQVVIITPSLQTPEAIMFNTMAGAISTADMPEQLLMASGMPRSLIRILVARVKKENARMPGGRNWPEQLKGELFKSFMTPSLAKTPMGSALAGSEARGAWDVKSNPKNDKNRGAFKPEEKAPTQTGSGASGKSSSGASSSGSSGQQAKKKQKTSDSSGKDSSSGGGGGGGSKDKEKQKKKSTTTTTKKSSSSSGTDGKKK